jgi:hypothetical protein
LDLNFEPADHIVLTRSHHFLLAQILANKGNSCLRFTSRTTMV